MAVDWKEQVDEGVSAAKITYNALVSIAQDAGIPGFIAQGVGFAAACFVAIGRILYILVLFTFVGLGTTLAAAVLQVIGKIRKDGAADFAKVTGQAMGEFMAMDTSEIDFSAGKSPAESMARAQQLGELLIKTLSSQFGEGPVTDASQGAAAAERFAGYGMNFATSNEFLGLMVEVLTDDKLANFAELGEAIARVIGLPRLTRQALRPLVRNAVEHPYDRAMRAKYRADLLNPGELVKEFLAGRISEDDCNRWLSEHGLSDTFIAATKAQHTPSLHEAELEELTALGIIDIETRDGQLKAQGIPDSIIAWRVHLLTYKRLQALRGRILGEVQAWIHGGFLPASAMNDATTKLGLPQDEAALWATLAGYTENVARKRISEGDMLFLYEAAQVTDAELENFLVSEGYSSNDVQLMLAFYRLKAAAAAHTKTGGTAAKAQHAHNEHVAYVTDEITGLFSRPPTTDELNYWVKLLDTAERTKGDFKTELKALDTSGSAIPPTVKPTGS